MTWDIASFGTPSPSRSSQSSLPKHQKQAIEASDEIFGFFKARVSRDYLSVVWTAACFS